MKRARSFLLPVAFAIVWTAVPVPSGALTPPATLADVRALGTVDGPGRVVDPPFPIDYIGVSWVSGREPAVRFLVDGAWTGWAKAHQDEIPATGARTFSRLIPAVDADAFQIRGATGGVRAVAINTTDGPRSWTWIAPTAEASHLAQPTVVSRSEWGADESYRFNSDGSEKWPPAFYPTQKLIVHHTATLNDDPDPAATVRAIYRYHAIDRGFGDIGYNFLVDSRGRIYKGRYSGPPGTRDQDTATGEDPGGLGVTAAHTSGANSGTMGISVLGTYTSTAVPAAARSVLVDHLAWESERHALDPLASSTYVNPVNGSQRTAHNISGHRDWVATECPGESFYGDLPALRRDVADRMGSTPPPADTQPPVISSVAAGDITRSSAVITWSTDEPADSQVEYWVAGDPATTTTTTLDPTLVTAHRVGLTGLTRRTTYSYRVRSADASGNLAVSAVYSFRTKK